MPDVQANIVLQTTGGDESAEEIGKATAAIQNVTSASSGMQAKFQERFQHVGLMLFAGDSLRASGLGMETRGVILLLNSALTAAETAGGVASGGLLLVVTALTALAGIIVKVIDHHKDLLASLEKTHEAQQKQLETTDKSISTIKAYIAAGGEVTPALQQWLTAEENLRVAQIARQEATDKQVISTLQATVAQEKLSLATTEGIKVQDLLTMGIGVYNVHSKAAASAMALFKKSIDEENLALQQNQAQLAKTEVELQNLREGHTQTLEQMTKDMQENQKAMSEVGKQGYEALQEADKKSLEDFYKTQDAMVKYLKKSVKDQIKEQKKLEENTEKVASKIGSEFGNMFAQMIVRGKSFTEEFHDLIQRMEEQFIEYVTEMIVKWIALRAVMGVASMGASEGAFSAMGAGGTAMALGGTIMADKPTTVTFGEAGPEMATFTPMSGGGPAGGSSGNGTVVNIGNITTQVHGVNDPNAIADKIGQAIIRQIRGSGQLSFTS